MLDQIDRYKLASPPDEPQEEGDGDWTADFDDEIEEHLWPEEGDDY